MTPLSHNSCKLQTKTVDVSFFCFRTRELAIKVKVAPATITQVNSSGRHFGHRLAQDQGHLFRFCWVPRETIWIAYGFAHQLSNDCRFMAGRSACPSRNKRTRAQARPCSRLRFHAYSHAGPRQSLSPRLRPTSPLAPPSLPMSMPRSPPYAQADGRACRAPTPRRVHVRARSVPAPAPLPAPLPPPIPPPFPASPPFPRPRAPAPPELLGHLGLGGGV